MKNQKESLRDKLGALFGMPVGRVPFKQYLRLMDEGGKISGRAIIEIISLILNHLEEMEKKKE